MRPRTARREPAPIRRLTYALGGLLVVAILFGGGGAEGPFNNSVIAGASALLLCLFGAAHGLGTRPLPRQASAPLWVLAALLLIIVLQLVPLPPGLWGGMPGHDLARAALELTPNPSGWRPLSLDPEATRRVTAALLLPAAVVVGLLGATRREALALVTVAVGATAASAFIGALQLILGSPEWLSFYDGASSGTAAGVFANANHQAALLLAAMVLLALLIRTGRPHIEGRKVGLRSGLHAGWLALPFLIIITLSTASRAGTALLLLAVPGVLFIALGRRSLLLWLGVLAGVIALVALIVMFSPSGNAMAIGQSFAFGEDERYAFLPDVIFTLRQNWPLGSGLGTFVPVFAVNENLDIASGGFVNHAHNDLLEWLIETGVLGALWLAALIGGIGWRVARVVTRGERARDGQVAIVLAGAFTLVLLALHSMIDYPLRMAAVAAVAALALGLILAPLPDSVSVAARSRDAAPRWPLAVASVLGVLIAAQVVRMGLAQGAVRQGNGMLSAAIRPQNAGGLALAAEARLAVRQPAKARQLAYAALERAPLTVRAARVLALADNDPQAAGRAWQTASAMGWRDGPTQFWAMQQALANGQLEVAAVRADAFLRTRGRAGVKYVSFIRSAATDPGFRRELVERMMLGPSWRRPFLTLHPNAVERDVDGTHAVLRDLVATPHKPTRGEARSTIQRLIQRGAYRSALDLYGAVRAGRFGAAIPFDDGGFDRPIEDYRLDSSPFDWTFVAPTGTTATIEEGTSRALLLETDGDAAYTLVTRHVALAQGDYVLQFRVRGAGEAPEAFGLSVQCVKRGPPLATSTADPLRGSGFEQRQLRFSVAADCPLILLTFNARPVGRPAQIEFDGVTLKRL
ncbi:O-antigen ligase family protein [Sphingomonas sp.]|uniref:O-antigen ligase family protein n=1 Tax=Sphingomonas sp. TaxID=28214 RepID=UPI00286DF009|nr:O-antigen ligase family protein [Sphingomonas sp.]